MASSQDSRINNTTTKQSPISKPIIAPKSKLVLAFAEELRRRENTDERSHSDSEIYDDILSFRDWSDDIYDDILPYTVLAQNTAAQLEPEHTTQSDTTETFQSISPTSDKIRGRKPPLLPKPELFSNRLQPCSCEDIYDDVIVYRMSARESSTKPDVPLKPSHLYRDPRVKRMLQFQRRKRAMDIEEIYDTTVSLAPVLTCKPESMRKSPEQEVHSLEELYIDPTSIIQDIADIDEIEPHNATPSKPIDYEDAHQLNGTELKHSSALRNPHLGNAFEIEDFVPNVANLEKAASTNGNPYEIEDLENQAESINLIHQRGLTVRCLDLDGDVSPLRIPKYPRKYATLPPQLSLPAGRTKFDPLPELTFWEEHSTLEYSDSEEEEYEELTLYEDVQNYQKAGHDKDYEDLDQAIIKALDLPEKIRGRATRLVSGKTKRKLQRSIKRRRITRPLSMPHFDEEQTSKEIEKVEDINSRSHDSETISHDSETRSHDSKARSQSEPPIEIQTFLSKEVNEQNTPKQDTHNDEGVDVKRQTSTEDDELEDEPIPFGKSREVFEMLLDASGIRRMPSRRRCSLQEPITEMRDDSEEEDDGNGNDSSHKFLNAFEFERLKEAMSTELKEYQDAGVVQLRSRSQIEEDIKNLTETAPTDPPPLPGARRPRTRLISRSDLIRHKRMLLQRSHTFDTS